jgi:hypothetical protein
VGLPGPAEHEVRCLGHRRADGKVKLYYMPKTVLEAISAYEDDEQFGFKSLPMPYDITINARAAGIKDVT